MGNSMKIETFLAVMPRLKRGIPYVAAHQRTSRASGIQDRPIKPGDGWLSKR
jgi:hypothetical protein